MPRRDSIQSNKGCFTVKRGRTTIAVIQNDNRIKKRPKNQGRSIKFLRICLIFFYGQFFATAIYTHLIHNIGLVLKKPDDFYPSLKIALGLFMIIHTLFAVVFIWKKKWKLISAGSISLILLSLVTLVTAIIDLVQRKERNLLHETEFGSTAAEIAIEGFLRLIAVFGTLFMVKKLREIEDTEEHYEENGQDESDNVDLGPIRIEENDD